MDQTVVVTGAAGFIGRWVVSELLDRNVEVIGIDDLSYGEKTNLKAFEDKSLFSFHQVDVCDEESLFEHINAETAAVIHLAAEIDVQESLEYPREYIETNVVGTSNVLEACRASDTRLVLVGTCMVYDMAKSESGIDETYPLKPTSPYAGSKLSAEYLAESYYHGYDLPVTILRPFNTYGPFQRANQAGGVVSIFIDCDLHGEPITVYGDGTQTRDLLYVTDCARFIVDAGFNDSAVGEVINAGTGVDISINDLAAMIASDRTRIEHVAHHHPQSEVQKLLCNPTKANTLLGWEPEISLQEGIDRVRKWMRDSKHR